MTSMPDVDRLYQTVQDTLGVPASLLSEDASPATVPAWDSLNHLNLVMALEGEFAVSFSADDVLDMRTIGLIRTILRERGVDV